MSHQSQSVTEAGKPLIEWSESFSVGVPLIDRDHRVLVDLINQLPAALDGDESRWVVGSVLGGLWDYTEYHFAREEALQEAAGYPDLPAHHGHHVALKDEVRRHMDHYDADPEGMDKAALLAFMQNWLIEHILQEDMTYRPFVEHNAEAQAVAERVGLMDGDDDPCDDDTGFAALFVLRD